MEPRRLSHELRKEKTPELTRRRWVVGLSVLGAAAGAAVTLYQTGVVRRLPDPPLPLIDSNKVDASDYAYKRLNSPDGPLMLVNYGITAYLASAGGKDRAADNPLLPIALAVKTVIDTGVSLQLAREEWNENRAFCIYCQAATLASIASVALAAPEAIGAARRLLDTERGAATA